MSNRRRLQSRAIVCMALSVLLAACADRVTPTPQPTIALTEGPTLIPVITATPRPALSISGRVWQDLTWEGMSGANGVFDAGEPAISGVLVSLGSGPCPSSEIVMAMTDADGVYSFSDLSPGVYCVAVDFSFIENNPNLAGHWTYPETGIADSVAAVTVDLPDNAVYQQGVNFGWEFMRPTPIPTAILPTPFICSDRATFVGDITIPDKTVLAPGASFVKTWRLYNSGTCNWDSLYEAVFVGGELMGGQMIVPLTDNVPPGNAVDVSIAMNAPANPGTYKGEWKLRNADHELFGIGPEFDKPFWVQIVVSPPATATRRPTTRTPAPATATVAVTDWRGEYYGNRDLSGALLLTRNDADVNFNWADSGPAAGLPADNFSARWTRTPTFASGTYRFYAQGDDGLRVWLDSELIIDQWHDATPNTYLAERNVSAGTHMLRVEYYERIGAAQIQFWWERLEDFAQWRGEYYANISLSGAPTLTRNDSVVDFNWGGGSAEASLPADKFSARWVRAIAFDAGVYRFHAVVDDGVRLWMDGQMIINQWQDGERREFTVEQSLSQGQHTLRIEYYENGGEANIRVYWERLSATPYLDWKGEYWSNRQFSGALALVRNDPVLDFSWGEAAAAPSLPNDNFAARWTRTLTFDAGSYRFHAIVDDGMRLWIDDRLVLDEWRDGGVREILADYGLTAGQHSLRVEYYDSVAEARLRVWWERLVTSTPTATATATATIASP